ncbi:biotin synthase BioB [Bartonella sp. HY406]|uniref:biotin synthase BioB n=1 Tax=Bartonella sp. HY406 TaxID=2979331 RepID=UPI0021C8957E|nr:biotin synthase BioB [Bartonella sp. HY406]UXN02694.1 biotin synthase BioB [Bartonella sp. HY406]
MSNYTASLRYDWTIAEIEALYCLPLLELLSKANDVHRQYHPKAEIQMASLLSIKTGGCPENCAYCSQSAHHKETELTRDKLMQPQKVIELALLAKQAGASRFCLAAAWRQVKDGPEFDAVLEMVRGIRHLGMEACVTLGMLKPHQARKLKQAGLTAYNHNIDTSPQFYSNIITTRTFDDRLKTLQYLRDEQIELCCGGIIGLGETIKDRSSMLQVLARLHPHPESVPINALVPIIGTPLQNQKTVDPLEHIRMIATARIIMPKSIIRLAAGRSLLNKEAQILCFLAGANSLFYGEKLLTTPNNQEDEDRGFLNALVAIKTKAQALV